MMDGYLKLGDSLIGKKLREKFLSLEDPYKKFETLVLDDGIFCGLTSEPRYMKGDHSEKYLAEARFRFGDRGKSQVVVRFPKDLSNSLEFYYLEDGGSVKACEVVAKELIGSLGKPFGEGGEGAIGASRCDYFPVTQDI